MSTNIDVMVCLSCRHPVAEHRDYLGCGHQVMLLGDSEPVTCVCLQLEVP